ncbi:AP2-like ethylene-responsive transcription factor AIL6 [Olea europaea subsp. europaea]|uniref:AP2-like ethylene-responsive transcription factor AIL6 n=1 Tax=Olea europaea subsp. europaea TaxID=158383 RepID=A0A8S0V1L2_OLEEU|nr:AP2-like ethylene-responsive transcription factor AIL6 [Olea europaea subsp. europaea]
MAPENNWLSFSLSSMEMLDSSSQAPLQSTMELAPFEASSASGSHHLYSFADNFDANGWYNQKPQAMYSDAENHQVKENNFFNFTSYMDPYMHQNMQPPPKLEDFLGGDSTEIQDSSLTHIYEHHQTGGGDAYFSNNEQQHLKTITGFQSFPANSGSEVDDSAFTGHTQSPVESRNELVAYGHCPISAAAANTTNALSLGVNNNAQFSESNNKAIVCVDSESSKRVTDTFGQRTSIYRGVTRHRWTGRYEAHLWDNSCRREGQARKGRQVYLGGYDKEDKAARAYDLAALKYWGVTATTNFPITNYTKELEDMKQVTKQEFIASLRRKSSGFSRGASIYRGVTRHHQQGRWQARIGRVAGNKDLYLGTFATEEEAAEAYDIAAIKFRGASAVTNFEMSRYDVDSIAKSPLPVGGTAKRLKLSLEAKEKPLTNADLQIQSSSNSINFASLQQPVSTIPCGIPFDVNLFHHLHPTNAGVSAASGAAANMVTPMPFMPSPADFFIWPHQSY